MIDYPTFCQLRMLLEERHLTTAQVAVELELDPKTVAKWAERTRYQQRQGSKRPSKLDPFKGQIVALLERHAYSAQQIWQQLKSQGYVGGYSILKEFVRLVRPVHKPAFLMLEFAAGDQPRQGIVAIHDDAARAVAAAAVLDQQVIGGAER